MEETLMKLNRRDVLKAASAASIAPMTGYLAPSSEAKNTTRLLEAGLRYELATDSDYHRIHVDSRPLYEVSQPGGSLALRRPVPERVARTFSKNSALVRFDGQLPNPAASVQGGPEEVTGLVTRLGASKRPAEMVMLTEPHTKPAVEFATKSDSFVVDADGTTVELEPTASRTLRLKPRTVSAKVIEGFETPDEDAPDWRLGKVAVYGTERVEVEPVLELQNLGELSVAQLASR